MGYGILSILGVFGICILVFWLVGSAALMVAAHKARREFRTRGYLRPPSGHKWLGFLFWKQYDYFENPQTRFYFGIAHFCFLGLVTALAAGVILIGSDVLFKSMDGVPGGGMSGLPSSRAAFWK